MPELSLDSVFHEVAALLVLAAAVGFAGSFLRQPLIVSFIAVGLIAGPAGLNIVSASPEIELLSELGVSILLFLVGIKLDLKLIRSLGAVALTTGLGQVLFTAAIGYGIGLAIGLAPIESLYVAVALTFSSTIIIVKLLSDKREIDALHGQVALGLLIVQDLVIVFTMIALSAIAMGASGEGTGLRIAAVLGGSIVLLAVVLLFVRFVADPLTERLARAPELLMCFALAMAALFAAVGETLGFGKELGGLLAGVSLASTRYREAIASRLNALRDFLLLFFFITLGYRLELANLGAHFTAAAVFSAFVLIGNPLIIMIIMGAMGFRKRTGFLAGLTVAQISEFSLILVAMGVSLGHIAEDMLALVTLVGLITIAASTYMITYSHRLYDYLEPLLHPFERRATPLERGSGEDEAPRYDVVVFGIGRFGSAIGTRLRRRGLRVLGVDFNPAVVVRTRPPGFDVEYGDATDAEYVTSLPLAQVRWAVSTMPVHATGLTHDDSRRAVIQALRSAGYQGKIAVTAIRDSDAEELVQLGADLVLQPFRDAADRAVELLTSGERPQRLDADETYEEATGGP